ncbi:hypothetical protein BGZ60DRAFT_417663 [Tricladium varicosporioides]|nr:hypothetical protein BGZ60DRAFT_417663 [Hymenoscyphus varicosporioides]
MASSTPCRLNIYFLPGQDIDWEVIAADIYRYLGNDASVQPGASNSVEGYFIKAYRNLTTVYLKRFIAPIQCAAK